MKRPTAPIPTAIHTSVLCCRLATETWIYGLFEPKVLENPVWLELEFVADDVSFNSILDTYTLARGRAESVKTSNGNRKPAFLAQVSTSSP